MTDTLEIIMERLEDNGTITRMSEISDKLFVLGEQEKSDLTNVYFALSKILRALDK